MKYCACKKIGGCKRYSHVWREVEAAGLCVDCSEEVRRQRRVEAAAYP